MGYGPWGLGFWEVFILLWLATMFFKPRDNKRFDHMFDNFHQQHSRDKAAYQETLDTYEEDLSSAESKIENLEERIRVLERIVTDEHKTHSLNEEIESLRRKA